MSDARLVVRTADDAELDLAGEITLAAYTHDGFLEADHEYAMSLLDGRGRSGRAELLVATYDDELVGTVTFCPPGSDLRELAVDGEGEFRMLAVVSTARGLGVGRALVAACFARCTELGLGQLVLCSMVAMTTAHRLYAAFGFVRDPDLDFEPVPGVLLWAFRAAV